jgi:hypothetical protein
MMERPPDEAARATHLNGRFELRAWPDVEPTAGIVGEGSLTLTDDGVHVSAHWDPSSRRVIVGLLGALGVTALIGVLAVCAPPGWATALALGEVVGLVGSVALAARVGRRRPYARLIPWSEVSRAGLSQGQIVFEVQAPQRGVVRFSVPGWGMSELKPYAQEIARASRR